MRECSRVIGLAAVVALAAVAAIGGQAKDDPFVGMWMLDSAKSTFKPGPPPKSVMLSVEPAGKGYKISVDAVGPDGKPARWGFTSDADGKDVPVTGNPAYETANLTRLTATSATTVYKKSGKSVVTVKSTVSGDGKTLTTTATGTNPAGQEMNNVSVYMKH